jgi:hypothetical protein
MTPDVLMTHENGPRPKEGSAMGHGSDKTHSTSFVKLWHDVA